MTDESGAVGRLAEWAATFAIEQVPDGVKADAREVLLDTIGVICGGVQAPEVRRLADRLASVGEASTVIGARLRSTPMNAALVNGTAATWLDFDSGHRHPPGTPLLPAGHPPVHLVPAALAVAEQIHCGGDRLLAALIAGYEVCARIGVACRIRPEVHPHGTFPTIGAAVAVGVLRGYGAPQVESAIRRAAGLTLLPSFENAYQGCTVRNVYAGLGAANGILAADLDGVVSGERGALASIFGGIASDWFDPKLLLDGLGTTWEIGLGYIKPFPCCRYAHPAIEAALAARRQALVPADMIDRVEVLTYDLAATLTARGPSTGLAAKFSIPYSVATAILTGSVTADDYRDDIVRDPGRSALAGRVEVVEDPAMTAVTPGKRPALVRLHLHGGQIQEAAVERSGGGPDAPLSDDSVNEKFLALAAPVLGPQAAERALHSVRHLEDVDDIRSVSSLLHGGAG